MKNTLNILLILLIITSISSCHTYCVECIAFDPVNDSIVNVKSACDKDKDYVNGFTDGFKKSSDSLGRVSYCVYWDE